MRDALAAPVISDLVRYRRGPRQAMVVTGRYTAAFLKFVYQPQTNWIQTCIPGHRAPSSAAGDSSLILKNALPRGHAVVPSHERAVPVERSQPFLLHDFLGPRLRPLRRAD